MKKKIVRLKKEKNNMNPIDTLLYEIETKETSRKSMETQTKGNMENVEQVINTILDDITVNTYASMKLNPNFPNKRQQDEIFDLGIINRESHQ